jgi:SynChlorMet cassette radical SAM/SPASM protein ScmF
VSAEPVAPPLQAVYLYPTGDCNQRCRHCWVDAAHVTSSRGETPLGAAELGRALEPARDLGLGLVKITGGEPFVRRDTLVIVEALRAAGLEVEIETNGTLVGEALAVALGRAGVRRVSVSLDGATPATHDAHRGQPGAFAQTVRAIQRLRAHDVPVEVLFTLTSASAGELDALLDRCAALEVEAFKLNFLTPLGRGRDLHAQGLALPVPRLLELTHHLEEVRGPALPFEVATAVPLAFASRQQLRDGGGHRCPILNILGVLGDGRLSICGVGYVAPELVVGDLRRDPIDRVWRESPLLRDLRDHLHARLRGVCGRCILSAACLGACRASAYTPEGGLLEPYWFCQQAEAEGLFPASRLR